MVQRLTPEERLRQAQAERGRLHRLSPSRPLQDAADAAAFVRERRIVTETGHAGVPVLAHTGLSTKEGRAARVRLERLLLAVSVQIHTDRGSHTAALRPWSASRLARRSGPGDGLSDVETAMDLLLESALSAAVVVPEREARKWFDFATERLDQLVAAGRVERLVIAPRQRWLLPAS